LHHRCGRPPSGSAANFWTTNLPGLTCWIGTVGTSYIFLLFQDAALPEGKEHFSRDEIPAAPDLGPWNPSHSRPAHNGVCRDLAAEKLCHLGGVDSARSCAIKVLLGVNCLTIAFHRRSFRATLQAIAMTRTSLSARVERSVRRRFRRCCGTVLPGSRLARKAVRVRRRFGRLPENRESMSAIDPPMAARGFDSLEGPRLAHSAHQVFRKPRLGGDPSHPSTHVSHPPRSQTRRRQPKHAGQATSEVRPHHDSGVELTGVRCESFGRVHRGRRARQQLRAQETAAAENHRGHRRRRRAHGHRYHHRRRRHRYRWW